MKTSPIYRIVLSGSAALGLFLTSCGPSKVAQCNDLITVSNELSALGETLGTELEAELEENLAGVSGTDGVPDFDQISTGFSNAADTIETKAGDFLNESTTKLSAVELKDETLLGIQSSYVDLLDQMGTTVTEMADALRNMGEIFGRINPEELTEQSQVEQLQAEMTEAENAVNTAQQGFDQLETQEDQLVNQINTYCGVEGADTPAGDAGTEGGEGAEGSGQ